MKYKNNKFLIKYINFFLIIYLFIILFFQNCLSIQIACGKTFFPCNINYKSNLNLNNFLTASYTKQNFSTLFTGNQLFGIKNTYTAANLKQLKNENDNKAFVKLKESFPISNKTLRDAIIKTGREVQVIYNEYNIKPIDSCINLK